MKKIIRKLLKKIIHKTPILKDWSSFHATWYDVGFVTYLWKRLVPIFRNNIYVPYDKNSTVCGNILMGKHVKLTQRGGCYIQGWGKIFIGDYVEITQNCIIISSNHKLTNQAENDFKETIIGDHCWIASNSLIMAGVVLGPRTVVAAGSVVTKSFPEGYVLIGGNPAKVIKEIPREEFVPKHFDREMYGWIPAEKFKDYKQKHLQHLKFHYDLRKVTNNMNLVDGVIIQEQKVID